MNVDHRLRNQQILLNSLGTSHSLGVNKYESPRWSVSPSDVTLRLDSARLDVSRIL